MLIGSMGAGKSTVGRLLAARLSRPLRDSDVDLAAGRRRTGRQVAAEEGVDELHRWEADHLLRALRDPEPAVVTAAASVVDDERAREALGGRGGSGEGAAAGADARPGPVVVWLRARPETLARRIGDLPDHRRVLGPDPLAELRRLHRARAARCSAVADLTVDVDDPTPDDVADRVLQGWSSLTGSPGPGAGVGDGR